VNINKGVKEDKDTIHLVDSLNGHFRKHNVEGSVIIYYNATGTYTTNNPTDVTRQTFPPSTFKIINLLIALETGVIKNENEIIKWTREIPDKKLYSY
jgi:beta-lactamase class D